MTRAGAATPEPFDLSEISRSGDVLDALAARRVSDAVAAAPDDVAVRMLSALVTDVDAGAPPLPAPARTGRSPQGPGRAVVRAFVSFGVATVVLTTAGSAVAGGGNGDHERHAAGPPAVRMEGAEHVQARHDVEPRLVPVDHHAAPAGQEPVSAPARQGRTGDATAPATPGRTPATPGRTPSTGAPNSGDEPVDVPERGPRLGGPGKNAPGGRHDPPSDWGPVTGTPTASPPASPGGSTPTPQPSPGEPTSPADPSDPDEAPVSGEPLSSTGPGDATATPGQAADAAPAEPASGQTRPLRAPTRHSRHRSGSG